MSRKKNPPPGCDLTLTAQRIADACGVSLLTVRRWRREAGIAARRGPPGVRRANLGLWGMVTEADWRKGSGHVGRLIGVTRQAARQMRQRLVREGCEIPELNRRRERKD